MKKDELAYELFSMQNTLNSLLLRKNSLEKEDAGFEHDFNQKEIFWRRQKKDFDNLFFSIRENIILLEKSIRETVNNTQKLISVFRNSAREEHLRTAKNRIDKWRLESFVTKDYFLKVLNKELNNIDS